jgi:hypothetical protein
MDDVYAGDGVGVCGEGAHYAGSSDVPEEYGFVVGAADEDVALWREGDLVDVVVVADERFCVCSALDVENGPG